MICHFILWLESQASCRIKRDSLESGRVWLGPDGASQLLQVVKSILLEVILGLRRILLDWDLTIKDGGALGVPISVGAVVPIGPA